MRHIQVRAPLCAQLNADRSLAVMLSLFMPQLCLGSQVQRGAGIQSWDRAHDLMHPVAQ